MWLLTTDDEVVELPYEWLQLLLCQYVGTVPTLLQVIGGGDPNPALGRAVLGRAVLGCTGGNGKYAQSI